MKWFLNTLILGLLSGVATQAQTRDLGTVLLPAKVVIVHDSEATEYFRPKPDTVRSMVTRGIIALTGKTNEADAWRALVSLEDVVGLKVFAGPGPASGTRPAVVAAVVEGLLVAGLSETNIIIWDKQLSDLRLAGFQELAEKYKVNVMAGTQAGYDPEHFYESSILGNLTWGDLEFGKQGNTVGRRSFLTRVVTRRITRLISIAPLLNHNRTGVSGHLYSVTSGSVDNFFRFESDRERLATALPEIFALPELYDKVALNITDALLCQYEGSERALLHYSAVLNELRFSKDPVALDALSIQELEKQRKLARAPAMPPNKSIYSNATLLELGVSDLKRIEVLTLDPVTSQADEARGW